MNSTNDVPFECRNCGSNVFFTLNRNGKRYLAERATISYANGGKSWNQPHHCHQTHIEMHQALLTHQATQLQTAINSGEIVKGQTVEVAKGRKYPIGTKGIVFWVADKSDQYGTIRVGFTSTTGEKIFINIDNLITIGQQHAQQI